MNKPALLQLGHHVTSLCRKHSGKAQPEAPARFLSYSCVLCRGESLWLICQCEVVKVTLDTWLQNTSGFILLIISFLSQAFAQVCFPLLLNTGQRHPWLFTSFWMKMSRCQNRAGWWEKTTASMLQQGASSVPYQRLPRQYRYWQETCPLQQ